MVSCLLRLPHNNDVRFVFTSCCLYDVWFVHRICLRVVVSNTIWLYEQHVRCFVRGGSYFLSRSLGFTPGFWWVRSASYVCTFCVLLCVCALFFFVLCFVCQMSILDCSVGVLYRLLLHSSEVVLHVVTVWYYYYTQIRIQMSRVTFEMTKYYILLRKVFIEYSSSRKKQPTIN